MKKYVKSAIFIIASILISISILYVLIIQPMKEMEKSAQPYGIVWNEDEDVKEEINYIRIKGFDTLTMIAKQEEQLVAFSNPSSNKYYMILEIEVHDTIVNSRDVLWTSDKLYPGYGVDKITLNRVMQKGKYEAKYIVRCFDVNTDVEVNGCVFDFVLNVE